MPRPLPVLVPQAIGRRCQHGQDGRTIAADLGLAPRTVRRLIPSFRPQGPAAVSPSSDHCGATPLSPRSPSCQRP